MNSAPPSSNTGQALVITAPNGGGREGEFFIGTKGERVQQLTLLTLEMANEVEALEKSRAIYTADRLLSERPKVAQWCLTMIAGDVPWRVITELTHVHHYTLDELARRFPAAVADERASLGRRFRLGARIALERLIDRLPHIPIEESADAQRMSIVAEKLAEKGELLLGGVTQRTESVVVDEWRELAAVLKELPRANSIEAQIVTETGSCGQKSAPIVANAAGPVPNLGGDGLPANKTAQVIDNQPEINR
ncbi:MAG TPA: hypothetical protein VHC95_06930 [Opitutales bacterium]|nr:hypothetical protein [Opitutales bacterium]